MIDLKQLYYFTVCADIGSMSKASEVLFSTQPNVSRVIKQLEQQLDMKLFTRKGKGVVLTEDGYLVYQYATDILDKMHSLESIQAKNGATKSLTISATPNRRVASCFSKFVDAFDSGQHRFKFLERSAFQVISDVENGLCDLGITFIAEKQRPLFEYMLYKKRLVFTELMNAELVVQVGPRHPYFNEKNITGPMIQSLKFLVLYDGAESYDFYLKQLKQALNIEQQLNEAIVVNSDEAMLQLLMNTDRAYITYHPMGGKKMFSHPFHQYLNYLPIPTYDGEIWMGYIKRIDDSGNQLASAFLSFFEENF